jgi:hypothetical protein
MNLDRWFSTVGRALVMLAIVSTTPSVYVLQARAAGTITLVGQTGLPNTSVRNSDVWGWTDPNTAKNYAVVGKWPSTPGDLMIIDVSTPSSPVHVATILSVPSFDMKVWVAGTKVYMYACDGNASGGNDSQIWDITNPLSPVAVGTFPTCHNIFIDGNGYMYLSYSTTRIYELNTDPESPTFVWTDSLPGGHDVYAGDGRLYDFHGSSGTFIYDISDPNDPSLLGQLPPSTIVYHHSGWTSADHKYLYVNDELGNAATADITVWNIANPEVPVQIDEYTDANATIHNTFRIGNYLHASFYVAGYRVFDIGGPNILLADEYDTSAFTGNGAYEGCWGIYPFAPTGYIYASDMQNGFYVFSFTPPVVTGVPEVAPTFSLAQNYPNPFNPTTSIRYELSMATNVRLLVFNTSGQQVRTLVNDWRGAGPHLTQWDGRDDSGKRVASGVYFYRLQAADRVETRRMILLK